MEAFREQRSIILACCHQIWSPAEPFSLEKADLLYQLIIFVPNHISNSAHLIPTSPAWSSLSVLLSVITRTVLWKQLILPRKTAVTNSYSFPRVRCHNPVFGGEQIILVPRSNSSSFPVAGLRDVDFFISLSLWTSSSFSLPWVVFGFFSPLFLLFRFCLSYLFAFMVTWIFKGLLYDFKEITMKPIKKKLT